MREYFLLSGVFYLTLLAAGFKDSLGLAVQQPEASFELRVSQPWNLPFTGFEPTFLKVHVLVVACLDDQTVESCE